MHERRCVRLQPFLEFSVRLEFRDLDAVDRRPGLADLPDFLLAHLPHPNDAMPLQARSGQVGRGIAQWPVEVAAPNQHQVHEIAREFEEQPIRRVEFPFSQPTIGKPRAVAVLETDLDHIGALADAPQVAEGGAGPLANVVIRFLGSPTRNESRLIGVATQPILIRLPVIAHGLSPVSAAVLECPGCSPLFLEPYGPNPRVTANRFPLWRRGVGFSGCRPANSVADIGLSSRFMARSNS